MSEIREHHKTGIGGSGAAACFGVKAFVSPYDLYASCLGLERKEPKDATPMDIGNHCEPFIRQWYEKKKGRKGTYGFFRHKEYDWLIGHLDWISNDQWENPNLSAAFAEFKVAGIHSAREWGNPDYAQVPLSYYLQGLHYSILTGIQKWDLVVLLGTEIKIYPCEADKELADALIERERHFWHEHVLKKVPPPPDSSESCRLLLNTIYKQKRNEIPWLDPETESDAIRIVNQLFETNRNAKAENDNLDELKNKTRAIIGERCGVKTDKGAILWKARKDGVRVFTIKPNDEDEA